MAVANDILIIVVSALRGADMLVFSDPAHEYKVLIPDLHGGKVVDLMWQETH